MNRALAFGQAAPCPWRRHALAAATLAAALPAQAFEIDTGNPDLSLRWDNTVRLNYAQRVESRDPTIGNSPIGDEGTYSFNKGQAVAPGIYFYKVMGGGKVRQGKLVKDPSAGN